MTRHTVPLFQRPYVWNQEEQWEPLWEDISGLLDRLRLREGDDQVASHFLGTIVLEQAKNPTGSLPRREVIDGQQRLTTLQLLLKAAEHALQASELEIREQVDVVDAEPPTSDFTDDLKSVEVAKLQIATLTENRACSEEEERYKVWPTNEDRPQYQLVMNCSLVNAPDAVVSQMAEAYHFFRGQFSDYLTGENTASLAKRLSSALRDHMKVIVLDLDPSDEPQAIFETLNAHGTPLLPADLMKNWLLWEAARQKIDADHLYTSFWRPFDNDSEYWRHKVGTGHAARARVDTFLQNWLTMETLEAVSAKHLYDRFLRYMRHSDQKAQTKKIDLHKLMSSIRHYADIFERIDRPTGEGRFNRFLVRLKAIDVIVFHPLLLAIIDQAGDDEVELGKVAEVLESFLVRRMVCNYQTRGYGSLALRLLEQITGRSPTEPLSEILQAELNKNETVPDKWPDDAEFREQWLHRRFYGSLRRDRVLMILRAIEEYYQTSSILAEPIIAFDWSAVQVEHVMPQKWVEHWPLPDKRTADEREFKLHGIGNLTLVSGRLNPKMSNGPWLPNDQTDKCKRNALEAHTLMYLNKYLLKTASEGWDEASIASRAEELFEAAVKIWSNRTE